MADEAEQVTHYFNQLKDSHDVIITTGGVSVGDYDFVRPCAFEVGFEQIFWKVKQNRVNLYSLPNTIIHKLAILAIC